MIKSLLSCTKSCQNFDVFGPPNIGGMGSPKFLTEYYKPGSQPNTWQSLVKIGQATSEIRWHKKKDLNYSGKTEWPAESMLVGGHN